jgi:perosamine synthetase
MDERRLSRTESIPVSKPWLGSSETQAVLKAISEGWVSSAGPYIDEFESAFASRLGVARAVSVSSGTTALHLALLACGVGPGDEVIVPSVTFIASITPIVHCGAEPVLVDVDPRTWGVSRETIEPAVTQRTRAIVIVHLYGLPVDIVPIRELARERGLILIEDAAEALGASLDGQPCGRLGDVGVFSFFGNKVMTTGEGGMLITDSPAVADRALHLRGHAQDGRLKYFHTEVGFNFRMTSLQAALGRVQLERLPEALDLRHRLFETYRLEFARRGLPAQVPCPLAGGVQAPWLFTVLLGVESREARDSVIEHMADRGVETRPSFRVAYEMPPFARAKRVPQFHRTSEHIASVGISLPTFTAMRHDEVLRVVDELECALDRS